MKVSLIFGTRPQIIKCIPLIRKVQKSRQFDLTLVNTGQHYDYLLSKVFLREFQLQAPSYDLGVGSGTPSWQIGNTMINVEKTLMKLSTSVCIVPGDTNSAIGSALASVKTKIPVIHLESGLRSYDEFMPEESNRKVIDHISQLLLAPTKNARQNLMSEGILAKRIVLTGDTMLDLLLMEEKRIDNAKLPKGTEGLNEYMLMTLHREENTEDRARLSNILNAIRKSEITTIFPIHPRTKEKLNKYGLLGFARKIKNLVLIDPLEYHSMMRLLKNSMLTITDSGGMQKEAFIVKTPCITLRPSTEWIETLTAKANVLVQKLDQQTIVSTIQRVISNRDRIVSAMKDSENPFGNGNASSKIVQEIQSRFS